LLWTSLHITITTTFCFWVQCFSIRETRYSAKNSTEAAAMPTPPQRCCRELFRVERPKKMKWNVKHF
jgi:hypothetical protein